MSTDTATLDRPPPTRHRFDVAAYYRMAEAGILADDDRVELIDGEVVDMAPIGSRHAGTTDRLNRMAAALAARGAVLVGVQRPLRLDEHNEPQPDLMLLKPRPDDYTGGHPTPADVLLLVEVAESSLTHDRTRKLPLYARFGVPEVWIIDLPARTLEVCRHPDAGHYISRERLTTGTITPLLVPPLRIDIQALLA